MITAIVQYDLPSDIGRDACREHFRKIAKGFAEVKGLIRKQFIWNENGTAGGVYHWETIDDAKRFYQGPWLDGILERYKMYPRIEYFVAVAVTDNSQGTITMLD